MIWAGHHPGLPLTSTQHTPRPAAGAAAAAAAAAASFLPALALGRFTATIAAAVAPTAC